MPISGEEKKITEENIEKDTFIATFTNGAFSQLENLKQFYNQPDLTEVIKLAISFLQQVRERREKEAPSENTKKTVQ